MASTQPCANRYNAGSVRPLAGWQSGHAAACKAVYAGSIPTPASKMREKSPESSGLFLFRGQVLRLVVSLGAISSLPYPLRRVFGRRRRSAACVPWAGGRAVDRHGVFFPRTADRGAAPYCRGFGTRGNHVPIVDVGTDFCCPAIEGGGRPEYRARSSTAPNLGLDVAHTAPAFFRNTLSAVFHRTRGWRGSYTLWRIWIVISPQKVIEPHRRLAEDPCCAWVFTIVCNMTRVAF